MKRWRARGEEKIKRSGRCQDSLTVRRIGKMADRAKIIAANSPSGRRQREAAQQSAMVGSGRDSERKLSRERKFNERLKTLRVEKPDILNQSRVRELRKMAVFHKGSAGHTVKLPEINEGKEVRREVWNPAMGDIDCEMKVVDDTKGVKIEGEDVWLIPRDECSKRMTRDGKADWMHEMLGDVAEASEKTKTRQKGDKM